MKIRNFLLLALLMGLAYYGYSRIPDRYDPEREYLDRDEDLRTEFILAKDSSIIELPAGHFLLNKSLILDGRTAVTIRGQGIDKTVLSFKGQTEGAEGIRITNGKNITLEDFTVEDAAGDNVKVMDTDSITFRRVKVAWTGPITQENGAYGLYPVLCSNVLIEDCESMGSSDAGIYVGQSEDVIVRNNKVYQNVAGIESENSDRVKIYGNECWDNTGGILVFNLPGLTRYGQNVEVFDNLVRDNNRRNFAVKGSIVSTIPPGTGMLVLATKEVSFRNNVVKDHRTLGLGIISYDLVEGMSGGESTDPLPEDSGIRGVTADYRSDTDYDPYPGRITLTKNVFSSSHWVPHLGSDFGKLFLMKLGFTIPDVVYDGILPAGEEDLGAMKICVEDEGIIFVQLDAANDFAGWSEDVDPFRCDPVK